MTEVNQKFLEEEIASLEKGYVETVINLIKGPVFVETCNRAIESAEGERKQALEKTLAIHVTNNESNKEAEEQLRKIISEVKKLRKASLFSKIFG